MYMIPVNSQYAFELARVRGTGDGSWYRVVYEHGNGHSGMEYYGVGFSTKYCCSGNGYGNCHNSMGSNDGDGISTSDKGESI
jgi:hypothetical protein